MIAVAGIVTTPSSSMEADHPIQTVGAGPGGVVHPGGHVQAGQGKAHPGADLAGEGKVMPEYVKVNARSVR